MTWYGDYVRSVSIPVRGDPFAMDDDDNDDEDIVMVMAGDAARHRRSDEVIRRHYRRSLEDKSTQTNPHDTHAAGWSNIAESYLPLCAVTCLLTGTCAHLSVHLSARRENENNSWTLATSVLSSVVQTVLVLVLIILLTRHKVSILLPHRVSSVVIVTFLVVCVLVSILNCFVICTSLQ